MLPQLPPTLDRLTKINKLELPLLIEHYIARLDVPVDDPAAVEV